MGMLVSLVVALASIALAVFFAIKYSGLMKRFKPVLSLDDEADRLQKEISRARSRASGLENSYQQAKQVYDQIQRENALLQEDLEDMSFGLYQPHFAFESSENYKTSDDVLGALNQLLVGQVAHAAIPGSVTQSSMHATYRAVILAMRKDVGFADTTVTGGEFQFVQF